MVWDYGFAPADVVTDVAGDVRPGIELRVWDAEVAGKAVAVQQDRGDGWKPVSRVLTDDVGRYRFKSETGPTVWVEDASGRRWRMDAWQTLGTMIDSAEVASGAAAESAASAKVAETKAAAALDASTQAIETANQADSVATHAQSAAAGSADAAAQSATEAAESAAKAETIADGTGLTKAIADAASAKASASTASSDASAANSAVAALQKSRIMLGSDPITDETIPDSFNGTIRTGTWTGDTDANGIARITYTTPMPAGTMMAIAQSGDLIAYDGICTVENSGNAANAPSRTGIVVNTHAANRPIRLNYIAIGWQTLDDMTDSDQLAAGIGNSWWRTGSGEPPTTFADAVDAPIVGARYRDTASEKTWVATSVSALDGDVTVEWEQTGPLPADMSATVEAQRLAKIVPGTTNPMGGTLPGTIPPAGSRFIIQAGSVVAPVNSYGDFAFDWPEAFSAAILSVQLTSGENVPREQGPIALRSATTLTTCRANAVGRTSGTVRCDYLAIGY